ncbi:AFG1 family ATPase [Alginatibacterium sediminis]|uniref:Cell division protein ZapE n=1 Tax=Alginatibacterium sediminis TaxID=2164068 RepID=A0A420E8X6_9ALTE|nr:cell division protein ZapE [Alginatibacterium sediminis]RKF15906.1 AFG1 family ATPase [Alginatibacterium sediminis]
MLPSEKYQTDIETRGFESDSAQVQAVEALDRLSKELVNFTKPQVKASSSSPNKWLKRIGFGNKSSTTKTPDQTPIKGLYFWGGVGRGKTYLMDTFFDCLSTTRKQRLHFHRFMYSTHDQLKALQGKSNPLQIVAANIASQTDIICFDEFFVSDITDAMILAGLFEALFSHGVVLVATSNIPPHDLYRNGLQRQRFLPTIGLIEQHCEILNVDSGCDYRMRTLEQAEIYHSPLDQSARKNMERYFYELSGESSLRAEAIEVNHRQIEVISQGHGVLLISFEQLCKSARSANDYIELAKLYHTVLLDGLEQMASDQEDSARRFIALIDEFYERNVSLIITAQVPMNDIYRGERLVFEFQRCLSRLQEMQSTEYLGREHLA